ncbi:AbrB/MazE/SpoVT family DNA-binding domain-containing protein [Ottowia sp. SB7-C50]|jgi:putative addiction module antidote|uniref:AbrB/MazE/SpoVT family DNA-binding domain-containing protein n=1 Tax=Ottowia sp. SB7-C50 TaxID=3081231 RepID=UPI0029540FDB|nr:AbrB/MazE/SpoVT family DNA-binding domain-containing protein [Ottowia sp. SB7-C50]WOP14265.1 AbrB/MazE/SpoVT family DNA-binding domain-containing protein [Ottowia sp. SB7-C50]
MSTAVALKVTQIGNSVGVILPKEMLARLKVGKGDSLYVTEVPDGVTLRPYDAEFAEQMEVAREIMKEYRDVLRELAK